MCRLAMGLSALGALVMVGAVGYGFAAGDGWAELRQLVALPWGVVSLVDVYVGFALFSGWVIYREASAVRSSIWVVAIMLGGNAVSCVYVFVALRARRGSAERFWRGRRESVMR